MQNIKYHILNSVSVIIFSLVTSLTINQIVRYKISPGYSFDLYKMKKSSIGQQIRTFDYYQSILESGFFKVALPGSAGIGADGSSVSSGNDLILMGTISGPYSIARALIQKKGELNPKIFALYRVSSEVTNDVYGYKLVSITTTKVVLKNNGEKVVLDVFSKGEPASQYPGTIANPGGTVVSKTISKAELQQKVSKNMDNALQGIAAKPNMINGVVSGYYMVRIPPFNILYQMGIRTGDIIKRINNHPIDSTQKLLQLWETLMNESKIKVDIERQNQIITLDLTISD